MQNANIKFTILINEGKFSGTTVEVCTDLEELEEEDLSSMLISKGYLEEWCNDCEYTVMEREITIITD